MLKESGNSVTEVARELDMSPNTLQVDEQV
ncbi:helix-turn-helix domain-containing protein [Pelosinus sp. UFO1]